MYDILILISIPFNNNGIYLNDFNLFGIINAVYLILYIIHIL